MAADQRVPTRSALELDLTVDDCSRRRVVWVKVGRSVITLDDGDGPGWAKQPAKPSQGPHRIGKVFKYETDEDVIAGFRRERQIKNVGLPQLHVRESCSVDDSLRLGKGGERDVDRQERGSWTSRGERERLGADPASRL